MTVNYFISRISDDGRDMHDFMFHFFDINRITMFMSYRSDIISEYRKYVYSNMKAKPIMTLLQSNVVDFYIEGRVIRIYTDFDTSVTILDFNDL